MVAAIKAMNPARAYQTFFLAVSFLFFAASAWAATQDDIGLTALRSVTTNLDGRGICVAQPEAEVATGEWQVSAATVGQPGLAFTYTSAIGTTNIFPNSVGSESGHADSVGNVIYGIPFGVATNLARVDNYEAEYFITGIVEVLKVITNPIVNQSFADSTLASQSYYDPIYDNYAAQFGTLFITGAGNDVGQPTEPPSTCYNGISVACYGPGTQSCVGPTADNGRSKPDLTVENPYTSFSTPYVSGAAALLLQAALRGDGGAQTNAAADARTLKALLLNGALKFANWTNGTTRPLDARYGAGVLNLVNSYFQLAGGKHGSIVSNLVTTGGAHPPTGATGTVGGLSGWDFGTNTSSTTPGRDAIYHYYFDVTNANAAAKFTATATLVWIRQKNKTSINNLNLFLYHTANSNLVNSSVSTVDNLEHLYVTNLAQGRYDLQVWKAGGASIVSASEPYALAWEFVPPPVLAISNAASRALTWPVYPAGFLAEARTNLLAGSWATNGVSAAVVTNGVNNIRLNTTNAVQFFRLRKPNL